MDSIIFVRTPKSDYHVIGVPRHVTNHSPTGFSWGYNGSGPADLALNILEQYLQQSGHDGPRVKMWKGDCFELAQLLYQKFKQDVVAQIPDDGGAISWDAVGDWMDAHA